MLFDALMGLRFSVQVHISWTYQKGATVSWEEFAENEEKADLTEISNPQKLPQDIFLNLLEEMLVGI